MEVLTQPKLDVEIVQAPVPPVQKTRRGRRVWVSIVVAIVLVLVLNVVVFRMVEHGDPTWRDPEFGLRWKAFCKQREADPQRPFVAILGSSRTAQGLRPDVIDDPSHPLVFNFSQSGGGPVCQAMILNRLVQLGAAPDALVLEYWPPLFRGDGTHHEQHRTDSKRLLPMDEPIVRQFFQTPDAAWAARTGDSALSVSSYRRLLLSRWWPDGIPHNERTDGVWLNLDRFGWWPGRITATPEQISAGWWTVEQFYRPMYTGYHVNDQHDAAFRSVLQWAKDHAVPVLVVQLPESGRFQLLKNAEAEAVAKAHLESFRRDFAFPFVDARTWVGDEHLPDGFHLTQAGATEFTKRLHREKLAEWLKSIEQMK
jgi:hypothetical protein